MEESLRWLGLLLKYADISVDLNEKFIKSNGTTENWGGDYISFNATELKQYRQNKTRVFRFSSMSATLDKSFFYLELTSESATTETPMPDFIKSAYLSCLVRWYSEI